VDLVLYQMGEFHHIDPADGYLFVDQFTGASVVERRLAALGDTGPFHLRPDLVEGRPVENRRGVIASELSRSPAEIGLEDLAEIHTRRHAEGIEDDVDRGAVGHVGHILDRDDLGDDALVAVTAGHLVAHHQLALLGDVDLGELNDARRKFVADGDLELAQLVLILDRRHPGIVTGIDQGDLAIGLFIIGERGAVVDIVEIELAEIGGLEHGLGLDDDLAGGLFTHAVAGLAVEDRDHLVGAQGADAAFLLFEPEFELVEALFLLAPGGGIFFLAREEAGVDDDALESGSGLERGVLDVAGFFTKDGLEEFLFGGGIALTLGSHLADQNVAGEDLGSGADDAVLIEVFGGLFGDVGNFTGQFLFAALGVAHLQLELLDVDRGEDVVAHDALGDDDGVFKIITAPGHKSDEDVAPEGQFTRLGSGAIGDHLPGLDDIAFGDDRLLVDAGVLVGAHELGERIGDHPGVIEIAEFFENLFLGSGLFAADDDVAGIDLFDHAVIFGGHDRA